MEPLERLLLALMVPLAISAGMAILVMLRGIVDLYTWKSDRWKHTAWLTTLVFVTTVTAINIVIVKL